MDNVIEIPLRNQNYDLSQDFINGIFNNLELFHINQLVFICNNGDNEKSIKMLMNIIDDFLDYLNEQENGLTDFTQLYIINRYKDYFIIKNIELLSEYLDNYSNNFENGEKLIFEISEKISKSLSFMNSFYYHFILSEYINKIFVKSHTKIEYVQNIIDIIKDIDKIIEDEDNIPVTDFQIQNYFINK